jgi:hypothetical protein
VTTLANKIGNDPVVLGVSLLFLLAINAAGTTLRSHQTRPEDELDIIISGALRRLTVSGSKPDKNAVHRRIKCGRTISGSQR